jgi:hypothetical protein
MLVTSRLHKGHFSIARRSPRIREGGQMSVARSLQVAVVFSAFLGLASFSTAHAGGRAAWFQSLRIPGTKASCCDISDCHRTEADWRDGNWWALVENKWRRVPQSSVLRHPGSLDGFAYVCTGSPAWSVGGVWSEPPIYCFVPPNWSS